MPKNTDNKNNNWELIAEIAGLLYQLEIDNVIDGSVEEHATLLESIYFQINYKIPKNEQEWKKVLKKAFVDTGWVDNPGKKMVQYFVGNFIII